MVTADGRLPDAARAWALLLALARRAGEGHPLAAEVGLALDKQGRLQENAPEPWVVARPALSRGWSPGAGRGTLAGPEAEMLLDLYMPLCVGEPAGRLVIGHLA